MQADKLIIANWKAYLTQSGADKWMESFLAAYRPAPAVQVVLAVPAPFLFSLHARFDSLPPGLAWAGQDVSPYPLGSYTGSTPAAWLSGVAGYVLVGHRERRHYFHETIQDVANKVSEALAEEVRPVLCVDSDTTVRQAASIASGEMERLAVAYTPADADRLEIARDLSAVQEGVQKVSRYFPGCPVLYGGGVNLANCADLLGVDGVSGVMVASGCLDPEAFAALVKKAAERLS